MTTNEIAQKLVDCANENGCSDCLYELMKDKTYSCQRFLIKSFAKKFAEEEDDLK